MTSRYADVIEPRPAQRTALDATLLPLLAIADTRDEMRIKAAFAALDSNDARGLYMRLVAPASSDQVATRFAQLPARCQARLVNFLHDAPRR
ncbi:hypothetical protein BH11MYX1_BH11MYX1_53650 [soil metagenome]